MSGLNNEDFADPPQSLEHTIGQHRVLVTSRENNQLCLHLEHTGDYTNEANFFHIRIGDIAQALANAVADELQHPDNNSGRPAVVPENIHVGLSYGAASSGDAAAILTIDPPTPSLTPQQMLSAARSVIERVKKVGHNGTSLPERMMDLNLLDPGQNLATEEEAGSILLEDDAEERNHKKWARLAARAREEPNPRKLAMALRDSISKRLPRDLHAHGLTASEREGVEARGNVLNAIQAYSQKQVEKYLTPGMGISVEKLREQLVNQATALVEEHFNLDIPAANQARLMKLLSPEGSETGIPLQYDTPAKPFSLRERELLDSLRKFRPGTSPGASPKEPLEPGDRRKAPTREQRENQELMAREIAEAVIPTEEKLAELLPAPGKKKGRG